MTIKCGFFNSVDKDRLYTAEDMTRPYELLVSDGVYGTSSDHLQVYAKSGMQVRVKPGKGKFKNKWFENDAEYVVTLTASEATLPRIDSIVVRIDTSEAVRNGSIVVKKGTPASKPVHPTMIRTDDVCEYRLADILVNAKVTEITQSVITDTRMTGDCGWITSLVKQVDSQTLFEQYEAAFSEWFEDVKANLVQATLIAQYNNTHVATSTGQTVIPIGIAQYNINLDVIQVYVNGMLLIPGTDYTGTDSTQITLKKGVDKGTPVSFVVLKGIDTKEATSIVTQFKALEARVKAIEDKL